MVDRTDELRDDIERRRQNISRTVDEVQNRVSPTRVAARGSYRVRRWFIDTRDQIMGNDEPYYPWEQPEYGVQKRQGPTPGAENMTDRIADKASEAGDRASEWASDTSERVSDAASQAKEAVAHAPQEIRQQTRGNPMAAGLIAFGGGLLLGSILPETRTEHDIANRVEPAMSNAMSEAREAGREVADDLKDDARDAMEQVKETGSEAGQRLTDDAKEAAQRTRDRSQS